MSRRLTEQERFLRLCAWGSGKKVEEAIQGGADINEPALMREVMVQPVFVAAVEGNKRTLKVLISHGADYADELLFAVARQNIELIDIFLDCGADINIHNKAGQSPIVVALFNIGEKAKPYDTAILDFLLNMGANPDEFIYFDDGTSFPILTYSISINRTDAANMILFASANPDVKDAKGRTPLLYAVLVSYEAVEILLHYGADPNATDNDGRTPLMLASIEPSIDCKIIEALIENSADVNFQDNSGMTALMWAVTSRDRSCGILLSSLIRTGGFRTESWKLCCKFMFICTKIERETQLDKIRLLLKNGADPSIHDQKGMTAMKYAVAFSDDKIIKMLQSVPPCGKYF